MHFSGTGPKVGHEGYLWAFVRRTDAPPIDADVAMDEPLPYESPVEPCASWPAPLHERIEVIEAAARQLGASRLGEGLRAAARAAHAELGAPSGTAQVAGQDTWMRYDVPLGSGELRATGEDAGYWLAAALLGGNRIALVDSPTLTEVVAAHARRGRPEDEPADRGGRRRTLRGAGGRGGRRVRCDRW